jgi:hypothetical protein
VVYHSSAYIAIAYEIDELGTWNLDAMLEIPRRCPSNINI